MFPCVARRSASHGRKRGEMKVKVGERKGDVAASPGPGSRGVGSDGGEEREGGRPRRRSDP